MTKYFLDTYAIVEIIKGNKNYEKFLDGEFFTSLLNLYELYYVMLRDYGQEAAKKYFFQFKDYIIRITDDYIFEASIFKLKHKKQRIS